MKIPTDVMTDLIECGDTPWPGRARIHEATITEQTYIELVSGRRAFLAVEFGDGQGDVEMGDVFVFTDETGAGPLLRQVVLIDDHGAGIGWMLLGLRAVKLALGD